MKVWPLEIAGGSGDAPTITDVHNVQLTDATQTEFLGRLAAMWQEREAAAKVPAPETPSTPSLLKGDAEDDVKTAEMHAAILSGVKLGGLAANLDKMLMGIPVGTVLVGGIPALVLTEVVDGFVELRNLDGKVNYANIGVKVLGAYLLQSRMARNLLGDKAATFAAGAITIGALASVIPLDQWVDQLVAFITRRPAPAPTAQHYGGVVHQAKQVIYGMDHYSSAL